MKKLMWAISLLALIGTAAALQFMPDRIPMHYDLAGNIDRWGSKYESFLFPAVILCLSLVTTLAAGYFEKKARTAPEEKDRAGASSNARVLIAAGTVLAAVFTVLQGFMLYGSCREALSGAAKQSVDVGKAAVILLGAALIALGNFLPKTRRNGVVGVRVEWSMYNDNTWRKSNRFGAFALMIAGVLTVVLALLMKNGFAAAMAALGLVILAAIASVIYAHKVYVQELASEKGEP